MVAGCTVGPVREFAAECRGRCAPAFLCLAKEKPPRPVEKKAPLYRKASPFQGIGLLGYGSCWLEVLPKSGSLLPGAPNKAL